MLITFNNFASRASQKNHRQSVINVNRVAVNGDTRRTVKNNMPTY